MRDGGNWNKLGRIIAPDSKSSWRKTFTGPSFGRPLKDRTIEVFCTGRDDSNRSLIGQFVLDISGKEPKILSESKEAIFTFGELGAFDENGVSYPWIVQSDGQEFMYYVGWMPSVLTPFQNHMGLAVLSDNKWTRLSRAPILQRTNEEPFCFGSCSVVKEKQVWKMWYTSFERWGAKNEHKHYYNIKYAESTDGINWNREGLVCIDFADTSEYAIGRPSVLKIDDDYHMWFSVRGSAYRIGYAHSRDGKKWIRNDSLSGISVSESGWDSESICYSHVFKCGQDYLMLYNGNNYGKEGLGLARYTK